METLTTTQTTTISQLRLDVQPTSIRPLADKTIYEYKRIAIGFNEFMAKYGLTISLETIKRFFESRSNWGASAREIGKAALLYFIQGQPEFDGRVTSIAALKMHIARIAPCIKQDRAIRRNEYLTEEEIYKHADSLPARERLLFLFQFQTGMRINEAVNVKLTDCELSQNKNAIQVVVQDGKGHKSRTVYCKVDLFNQIKEVCNSKVWLFESKRGTRLCQPNYFNILRRGMAHTGFVIGTHTARHSCAMHLKKILESSGKGISAAQYIQKYLGHADIKTTIMFYFHDSPDQEVVDFFGTPVNLEL
jgi:integrase